MVNKTKMYNKIVGTGGIGKGMLFHSGQQETLGRSESRLVTLSNAKDYCKQQIVLHYTAELLGDQAEVCPIGYVGEDEQGDELVQEMKADGMNVSFIGRTSEYPTMISVCLQYPDKEGCNITAINNAALKVTPEYVLGCVEEIGIDGQTIVAAIPEVPVESRLELMKYGKEKGAYCILSVPVSEAEDFKRSGVFAFCDLLSVNEEEAQAILESSQKGEKLAWSLGKKLQKENPELVLLMTCGKKGAYSVVGPDIERIFPFPGKTVNTTGAGDAFLGGTIAGIAMGMKIQKGLGDTLFGFTPLSSAPELGTICAGMAVGSEDSIAREVTAAAIKKRIEEEGWETNKWLIK